MNRLVLKNAKLNSKFKRVLEEIRKCFGPEPKPIKPLGRMPLDPLGFGRGTLPGEARALCPGGRLHPPKDRPRESQTEPPGADCDSRGWPCKPALTWSFRHFCLFQLTSSPSPGRLQASSAGSGPYWYHAWAWPKSLWSIPSTPGIRPTRSCSGRGAARFPA